MSTACDGLKPCMCTVIVASVKLYSVHNTATIKQVKYMKYRLISSYVYEVQAYQ